MTAPVADGQTPPPPWNDPRPGGLRESPTDGWEIAVPQRLWTSERRALDAVIRAMLPDPGLDAPLGPSVVGAVATRYAVTLRYMAPHARMGLRCAILVLAWSPLWTARRLGSLASMDASDAARWLARLARGPLPLVGHLVTAARAALLTAYYDLPDVHDRMRYAPQPFMAARAALRARLSDGGAALRDDWILPGWEPPAQDLEGEAKHEAPGPAAAPPHRPSEGGPP